MHSFLGLSGLCLFFACRLGSLFLCPTLLVGFLGCFLPILRGHATRAQKQRFCIIDESKWGEDDFPRGLCDTLVLPVCQQRWGVVKPPPPCGSPPALPLCRAGAVADGGDGGDRRLQPRGGGAGGGPAGAVGGRRGGG